MKIKDIALKFAEQYHEKYVKWCVENPGKIMNGLSIKENTARDIAIGCSTVDELITIKKFYRALAKDRNEKGLVNGFKFSADAIEEITDFYINNKTEDENSEGFPTRENT
jgi:hypothetical protein